MRPWRVQLVSTATGTEMARAVVKEAARSAGFSCDVWDIPGFSMNPALNTSAASVRAVYDHDIIIALVDSEPGSRFALDDAPADMVTDLRAMGVLPPSARRVGGAAAGGRRRRGGRGP